jgi:hypothetical protein
LISYKHSNNFLYIKYKKLKKYWFEILNNR